MPFSLITAASLTLPDRGRQVMRATVAVQVSAHSNGSHGANAANIGPRGAGFRVMLTRRPAPAAQERVHDNQPVRGKRRSAPDSGDHRLLDHSGAELFAFPQRHDAVAAAGALPDAEGRLRAELRSDRNDNPDLAADLVRAAAGSRHVRRPPAATLLARSRHG